MSLDQGGLVLKEIGDYLRRTREEKGISLKEIQESTKISMRYLEAIDRGELGAIPGEVYRKGFLVNYANSVGLDGQEVLQKYREMQMEQEERVRQTQLELAAEAKKSHSISLDWSKEVYMGIVASTVVLLLGYSFVGFSNFEQAEIIENNRVISDHQQVYNHLKPSPEPTPETEKFPAPITVYAVFPERTWIQIQSDGHYTLGDGRTYDPTDPQQIWTAEREMIIQIGNPAGIQLTLNGRELEPVGQKGMKTTIRLSPNGLVAP